MRRLTGWSLGTDGFWRFDMPEDEARQKLLNGEIPKAWAVENNSQGVSVTAFADEWLQFPKLFAAYPELAEIPITLSTFGEEKFDGTTGLRLKASIATQPTQGQEASVYRLQDADRIFAILIGELEKLAQQRNAFAHIGQSSSAVFQAELEVRQLVLLPAKSLALDAGLDSADAAAAGSALPRAVLASSTAALKKHPAYFLAVTGDETAAATLAADLVTLDVARKLEFVEADAVVGLQEAREFGGANAIPSAAAKRLAYLLALDHVTGVTYSGGVRSTDLDGLSSIFSPPTFDGQITPGKRYILVDDALGQGGSVAAMAEHIKAGGGHVAAVLALHGSDYSAELALSSSTLSIMRAQLGDAEQQFQQATGRSFDQLTESEARYLANFKPQSAIHERIAETLERGVAPEGGTDAGRQTPVDLPDNAGDDGVRFSRRRITEPSSAAPWGGPSSSKWDDMVYRMQDKHVDTKRVMQAIEDTSGAIADDLDVYLSERLFHGRSAKRTQDFVNDELNPLTQAMSAAGLKIEDLDEYLHARHAKEANAVIAQRNPDMPDGGSGMTDAAADDYFAKLKPEDRKALDALAARVDTIMKDTRELYVDYELESRATVDSWGQMFQNYVPLMREDQEGRPGTGQGISIKGRETKGRTGSSRKVVDILANIALQRERVIVRGEKNRVAQALVGLAQTNPNPEFWAVDQPKVEQKFNPKTGLVENRHSKKH